MTKRLWWTLCVLFVGIGLFLFSIFYVDPESEKLNTGLFLLGLSILLSVSSFSTFFLFFAGELLAQKRMKVLYFEICLRRSLFLALIGVVSFVLHIFHLFGWIELVVLLLFFFFLELAFMFRKKEEISE